MLFYKNYKEMNFFEKQRFNLENRPTWEDIEFMLEEKPIKEMNFKINNKKEIIPLNIWKILIKLFQYKENKPIENLRKEAIKQNPEIEKYIETGVIKEFETFEYKDGKTLLEALKDVNIESYSNLYEMFSRGEHIGFCGPTSRFIGVMFKDPEFHEGKLDCIKGTKNSEDGGHAWTEAEIKGKKYIIDTSTMLVIPIELKEKVGYTDEKKPYNTYILINTGSNSDKYYNHYEELTKISTKDKFSYVSYRENIRELEKINSRSER